MIEAFLAITLIGWLATYLRMRARVKFLELLVKIQFGQIDQGLKILEAVFGKPKKHENNVVPFGRE